MSIERSVISVIDDDKSVRESLPDLLSELGFESCVFSSPEEFLRSDCLSKTKCLILDIHMPRMTGPEFQRQLKLSNQQIPIIFITARRDEAMRLALLEQGAIECLFKPFRCNILQDALSLALGAK